MRRVENIQHPTSNSQHPTPNIQLPTSNAGRMGPLSLVAGHDAVGDGVGEALAVFGGSGNSAAFGGIGEEAAFAEDGGQAVVAQDVVAAAADVAILGAGGADEAGVDGGGEAGALAAVVVGLDAVGPPAGG